MAQNADCLNEIFEYLEDDKVTLFSCLLVNRLWCGVSARILWKKVRNYDTLMACLPNESKEILRNNGIATDCDLHGRTLRKQLDDASVKGAFLTVIISPAEIERGQVTIRSMKDGVESKQQIRDIVKGVNELLLRS